MYGRSCRPTQPFAVLPRMGQSSSSSFPQNLPFELRRRRQAAPPSRDRPAWSDPVPRSGKRTRRPDAPVPGGSPADPLPTGPSGPAATPARRRSLGGGRPPAVSRELLASPHRSRPRELAGQSSSRVGQHTPAWRDSASPGSADHSWKRGRTGPPGTFSPTSGRVERWRGGP